MKRSITFALTLIIIALALAPCAAQAPQSFKYQSVARNSAGDPIGNANIGLRISVRDLTASGTIVYRETHTVVTNAFGLFSISVGGGTVVSGAFGAINWGTGSKFIEVEADFNGGTSYTSMGASELLSVPYALFSQNSTPGPAGQDGTNGLNVLSGTSNPGAGTGVNGEFYINTSTSTLFGPKAGGVWPAGVSLVGANGAANAWGLTGTSGTIDGSHFIGTTDNVPFTIRVNNQLAGRIDPTLFSTFMGYQAGNSNTTGSNNTAHGYRSLSSNTIGNNNTANGSSALQSNTTGNNNTAMGRSTLFGNTTGVRNTAIGKDALFSNTTGNENTASGHTALYSNTSGINNTSNGTAALYSNTTGSDNTANGWQALYQNTIGFNNTANGSSALYSNTSGSYNTASGYSALLSNTTGASNTAIGNYALNSNTTGVNNTSSGVSSLRSNTTGSYNTASGMSSLYSNTTGVSNTANGLSALYWNTTGSQNTACGLNALINNGIGNDNTAHGVSALYWNSTGSNNTASGRGALGSNQTGSNNTAYGVNALLYPTAGSNNTAIGYNAQVPNVTASNQIRIGNTAVTYAGVQVAWTVTSDKRWKDNIQPSALGLAFVNQLNPVSYFRKNDEAKKTEYGFIAQEIEKTLAEFGVTNTGIIHNDDEGMLSVRYNDLLAPMVKAIQEQQQMIEALQTEIELLKNQYQSILGNLAEENASLKAAYDSRLKIMEETLGINAQK